MCQKIKTDGVPLLSWAPPSEIEPEALAQLKRIATLPVVVHHIAVMPDVHLGRGATVGSVIPMRDAVAPAAVGVDIGCGMLAVRTNIRANELPDSLGPLRGLLEDAVPTHIGPPKRPEKRIPERTIALRREILERTSRVRATTRVVVGRAELQLGTLGSGNHFLELCLDESDHLWLHLHSGSRNLGATLAEFHMARAERARPKKGGGDPELAFFLAGTPPFQDYLHDLSLAQDYADVNRELMLARALGALFSRFPRLRTLEKIECRHNYVAKEMHFGEELYLTRKGAIAVPNGRLGLIPGSMGASSFVVRGRGSSLAFDSASHGAGRRMSRGRARSSYSLLDLEEQTKGVECRKDRGVIDEAPKAYKKIERVMDQQSDLVEIVYRLRPILCVKG